MILKVLLVIAVIAVVYFIFIKKKPPANTPKKKKNEKVSSDMIECPTCGVYFELNEGILSNGKYYCSQECVEQAK